MLKYKSYFRWLGMGVLALAPVFLPFHSYAECMLNKRVGDQWRPIPREELKTIIASKESHKKSGIYYMIKSAGVWYAAHEDCFKKTAQNPTQTQTTSEAQAEIKTNSPEIVASGATPTLQKSIRFELGVIPWETGIEISNAKKEKLSMSTSYISFLGGLSHKISKENDVGFFGGPMITSTGAKNKDGATLSYSSSGAISLGLQAGGEFSHAITQSLFFIGDLRIRLLRHELQSLPSGVTQDSTTALLVSPGVAVGFKPQDSQNLFQIRLSNEGFRLAPGITLGVGIFL